MTERMKVLVVDDDHAIRKLLERVAIRAGFAVDSAKDGVDALELLEKYHYEIAIVDLMMPRLSGYELVQKVSSLQPRPVVLVATAMANGDVASLDDSLVRRVIRKPFDIKAVADALTETRKLIEDRRELEAKGVDVAGPEAGVIPVAAPRSAEPDAPARKVSEDPVPNRKDVN